MNILPEKTVERLSEYRRTLYELLNTGKTHIFSHELARLHHITAVQVRRDMMFLGYASIGRRGYDIKELIKFIGKKIDSRSVLNVAVIGMGNYGKAISAYFQGKRPTLEIVAAFDIDPEKMGANIAGIPCYSFDKLNEVIKEKHISIAILTVPPQEAQEAAQNLTEAGIKGILNFTSVQLKVDEHVYLEGYDMITSLEKVAYYVKESNKRR
jgi:redox-sensing transcriptional repressor